MSATFASKLDKPWRTHHGHNRRCTGISGAQADPHQNAGLAQRRSRASANLHERHSPVGPRRFDIYTVHWNTIRGALADAAPKKVDAPSSLKRQAPRHYSAHGFSRMELCAQCEGSRTRNSLSAFFGIVVKRVSRSLLVIG